MTVVFPQNICNCGRSCCMELENIPYCGRTPCFEALKTAAKIASYDQRRPPVHTYYPDREGWDRDFTGGEETFTSAAAHIRRSWGGMPARGPHQIH